MIASMEQYILHLEGVVDEQVCNAIIKNGEEVLQSQAAVRTATFDNTVTRQDAQLYIPGTYIGDPNIYAFMQELTIFATFVYGDIIPLIFSQLPIAREAKFQKTKAGQLGFGNFHVEQGPSGSQDRAMVWMLYLNNVYEGGETEFLDQQKKYIPKAGDFLMWPAGITHPHRGNPPYSNDKYILTGWLHSPSSLEQKTAKEAFDNIHFNGAKNCFSHFKVPESFEWK